MFMDKEVDTLRQNLQDLSKTMSFTCRAQPNTEKGEHGLVK